MPKDMGWELFLSLNLALAAAIYRMDPSTVNEADRMTLQKGDRDHEDLQRHHANPWNWPTDASFLQAMSQQQQAEQATQDGDEGADEGDDFGGWDWGDLDDDGDGDARTLQKRWRRPSRTHGGDGSRSRSWTRSDETRGTHSDRVHESS